MRQDCPGRLDNRGNALLGQIVSCWLAATETVTPDPGVPKLPLSSKALLLIVTEPATAGVQAKLQLV